MRYGLFALLELLLVFGVALGWGVYELVKLRRDEKRFQESRAPDPPEDPAR